MQNIWTKNLDLSIQPLIFSFENIYMYSFQKFNVLILANKSFKFLLELNENVKFFFAELGRATHVPNVSLYAQLRFWQLENYSLHQVLTHERTCPLFSVWL